MIVESIRRICKTAFLSFWRNGWLSTATISVMSLALFVFGGLLLLSVLMNTILDGLQSKIDISVYFIPDTPEEKILDIKSNFEKILNVKGVSYVSQAQALETFKEKHKDDLVLQETIAELKDQNPLEASLNITAADASQFQGIASAVEAMDEKSIAKINFEENKVAIDRLSKIMAASRTTGAALAAILAFIAALVAFNTVRLAIYTAREEINVMRLVGATAWYIRGPFLVEGILDGIIAAVAATVLYLPVTWFLSPKIESFIGGGINMFQYFSSHFFEFFAILLVISIVLGALSSLLAVRRYLKV